MKKLITLITALIVSTSAFPYGGVDLGLLGSALVPVAIVITSPDIGDSTSDAFDNLGDYDDSDGYGGSYEQQQCNDGYNAGYSQGSFDSSMGYGYDSYTAYSGSYARCYQDGYSQGYYGSSSSTSGSSNSSSYTKRETVYASVTPKFWYSLETTCRSNAETKCHNKLYDKCNKKFPGRSNSITIIENEGYVVKEKYDDSGFHKSKCAASCKATCISKRK